MTTKPSFKSGKIKLWQVGLANHCQWDKIPKSAEGLQEIRYPNPEIKAFPSRWKKTTILPFQNVFFFLADAHGLYLRKCCTWSL